MKNNSIFSRNRKIHNPFKKRNSPSSKSHSHSVHQQNVISALGGMPHDFDFDFQSATETPTKAKKEKRNSSDSYNPRQSFIGFKLWFRLTM
ncbi:7616_t:CDS:2, partial [Gigaspora rosea]